MNADMWKTKIVNTTNVDAVRYQSAIETLADILEQRDLVFEEYLKNPVPVIEHTNKAGATNATKNPLITLWIDLNSQALAYFRELGMTPSAYRKMVGEAPVEKKESALVAALKAM